MSDAQNADNAITQRDITNPDDPRHGTYAGAQAHGWIGQRPCDACRKAKNDYMKRYRVTPEGGSRVRRTGRAKTKALWALAKAHPEEYQRHYIAALEEERRTQPITPERGTP